MTGVTGMSARATGGYAELAVTTNFSFLRGASHPAEMVTAAAALGFTAIGIADRNSLAGVVRAHVAARDAGLKLVVGARLVPTCADGEEGIHILCYPHDRAAYGRLCRLLTTGKRRAEKGACEISLEEIIAQGEAQSFIVMPAEPARYDEVEATLAALKTVFPKDVALGAQALYQGDDARRLATLAEMARRHHAPLAATNDVWMHHLGRKPLMDLLVCIREGCTIDEAGLRLQANAERHLKDAAAMAHLFRHYPEAVAQSNIIAARCCFNLEELRYEYPEELTQNGRTPQEELEYLAWQGAKGRYPDGIPGSVRAQITHELNLIGELFYAPYFLTVQDIVRFAREKGILCQGRGSAANSAVCYCLGITAVDPSRLDLLFERFVSAERNEPPDIDVDFEHERREEVIQYIYEKYSRERAGLAATVIHYRSRRSIREVGKAMGLSEDTVSALAGSIWGWSNDGVDQAAFAEIGLDPNERRLSQTLELAQEICGFPRHLSQHVGGFVMTRGPLCELVPIENAAMEDRTVIEWDKDDLDALGILKVDVLALGMLTCLKKGFDLLTRHYGKTYGLATVPAEDPAVYDMLCEADSIGVFQVESRAQMTMLPRLKPRDFYDLVVEVAIVRPGPIQGDMVHPYLRRRNGEEQVDFPSEELRQVLGKTLGVPLFQEQAMKIAIVAAGFTPSEADKLRRAMATFRNYGNIEDFRDKMIGGMIARGYDQDFAERCFRQIEGFGTYGFPESHAASFALLVYVSAWMKCHYPEVFAAALLNSQPMGFYAPAQIVRDAREHGVEVLPVDVNASFWDCSLEPATESGDGPALALRLGFRQVKGFKQDDAVQLLARRGNGYPDPLTLWRRGGLSVRAMETLARGDAYRSMDLDRRAALWAIKRLPGDGKMALPLPLFAAMNEEEWGEEERGEEPAVVLPRMELGEHVVEDYSSLRLSLKAHPLSFLRDSLVDEGIVPATRLSDLPNGARLKVAGLVLVRQRPGSAKGVIFATLEDETGVANVVVWPDCFERYRMTVLKARLLFVEGRLQREGLVIHVVAETMTDMTHRLLELTARKAPLEPAIARADEVKHPPHNLQPQMARHPRNVNPMPPSRDFK